ncbi:hypothetical protein [Haloarchaeobius salinus]|uniref:hypothetical protein n=1 Tax=Haloarchaeobius salinus TaxID=1198298 RepID=UPI00210CAF92|nr:hypothetical protein [Haloarchaeobius salinus]
MSDNSLTTTVTVTPLTRVATQGTAVVVRRVTTPKGARLELDASRVDERIRLDAVTLECLAWQDRSTFLSFLDQQEQSRPADELLVQREPGDNLTEELTRITNEFGHVEIQVPDTDTPTWVELVAPKLGYTTRLNAVALESIASQDQSTFTELLRQRLEDPKT